MGVGWRLQGKKPLHFLHVRKTGGVAVKRAFGDQLVFGPRVLLMHPHSVRLRDIPPGQQIFFFLREPCSRFVSGFSHRQRAEKRLPTVREVAAFEVFSTPNELAEALSAADPRLRERAEAAIHGMRHVNSRYLDWFHSEQYFRSRLRDVFMAGCQETLTADFARLTEMLGAPATVVLPTDDRTANRAPAGLDKHLSPAAVDNLRRWYDSDYRFVKLCRSLSLIDRDFG